MTQWRGDGEKFYEEHRGEHEHAEDPVFLVAGVHYELRPLGELRTHIASGWIFFPEDPTDHELTRLRSRWALRRRPRPMVPSPEATPLPEESLDRDYRAQLFSVYLRCWVLRREDAVFPLSLIHI